MNKEQFEELQRFLNDNSYENEFKLDGEINLTVLNEYNVIVFYMVDYIEGYQACYQIRTDITPLPNNVQEFNKLLNAIWYYNNIEIGG